GGRAVPAQSEHPRPRALAVARGHPSGLPARRTVPADVRWRSAACTRPGRGRTDRPGPVVQEPAGRALAAVPAVFPAPREGPPALCADAGLAVRRRIAGGDRAGLVERPGGNRTAAD